MAMFTSGNGHGFPFTFQLQLPLQEQMAGTCHCTTVFHDNLAQSIEKSSVQCKLQEKFRKKKITRTDV